MRSPSAVKPTMSANRTVTVRRSSRRGPAARSGVPQFRQKFAPSGFSVWQAGHVTVWGSSHGASSRSARTRNAGEAGTRYWWSMLVRVRLFAQLRERAGRDAVELDLPDGARVADALAALDDVAGGLPVVMAVNREYAGAEHVLSAGDELALVPPVSGGAVDAAPVHARVRAEPLSLDALASRVRDPRAGAVVTFSGVTREVAQLDYEAYAEMAEGELRKIAAAALERHGLCAVAVDHRIGVVPLSEASV